MYKDNKPSENRYGEENVPMPVSVETPELKELISRIPDFHDDFTIDMVIQKILTNDRQYDLSKIISAYEFAENAHSGQKRSSGQDYIIHPLAVALTVIELGMDTDTICAALLHDVVEDTPATLKDLQKRFGQDVAMLVDGVTKLSKVDTKSKERQQAENIRKMLFAMSQDIRVMIIKLADRLHNIRTLKYRPYHKQVATAYETLNIYAPIAHRLGIRTIKDELEDLSLRYIDPFAYHEIENAMMSNKEEKETFINDIITKIEDGIKNADFIEPPKITGRVKSIFSIYKKRFMHGKSMEEIYDKYAVRVIVSNLAECYSVLCIVNATFNPIPNRLKDYISHPKANMYQSIHTTVLNSDGVPFEVQIRTWEMHETAEYGIAAHWKYKEGIRSKDKMEQRIAWVRQLIEAQQSSDDVEDIVTAIKSEADFDEIVVMTPKGDTVELPSGSTVIDFAYHVHTEIGHKTVGAKVNGRIVPLDFQLETGHVCEIITTKSPDKGPNRTWLNFVKTNAASSKIRLWFKKEKRSENIIEGKNELERMFRRHHIDIPKEEIADFLQDDLRRHNCENIDDFYASIGYGGISLDKIILRIKEKYEKIYKKTEQNNLENASIIKPKSEGRNIISLDKIENIAIKFAQCCNPLPGDEIIGFITRGNGLSVHTTRCNNYKAVVQRGDAEELKRWCDIQWTDQKNSQLQTSFEVIAADRVGLLHDVTGILLDSRVPIIHSASRVLKSGNAMVECTIMITSTEQLKNVFDKIKRIKGVISVDRATI